MGFVENTSWPHEQKSEIYKDLRVCKAELGSQCISDWDRMVRFCRQFGLNICLDYSRRKRKIGENMFPTLKRFHN